MVGSLDALTLGVVLAGGSSNPPASPMATNSTPPPAHPNLTGRLSLFHFLMMSMSLSVSLPNHAVIIHAGLRFHLPMKGPAVRYYQTGEAHSTPIGRASCRERVCQYV